MRRPIQLTENGREMKMLLDVEALPTGLPISESTSIRRPRGWLARLFHRARRPAAQPHTLESHLRLAVQLELERSGAERTKCILLTSASSETLIHEAGGELAYAIASEMGRRVLLIDTNANNTAARRGVTELLAHGIGDLLESAQPTEHERLFSLPTGSPSLVPAALSSGRHQELIEASCRLFDTVILLGGPIMKDPKWLVFAPFVDHALLLTVEGRTYMTDLDASLQALAECKAARVSVVLLPARHTKS